MENTAVRRTGGPPFQRSMPRLVPVTQAGTPRLAVALERERGGSVAFAEGNFTMTDRVDTRTHPDPGRFAALALIFVIIAGLALLLWQIGNVLVLMFGAVLLAVVLRTAADGVQRAIGVSAGWAYAIALLTIAIAFAAVGYLLGRQIVAETSQLVDELPKAWSQVQSWLQEREWGRSLLQQLRSAAGGVGAGRVAGVIGTTFGVLGDFVLLIVLAVFLGASPGRYQRGALCLVPRHHEPRAADALTASGSALRQWLMGQAISMAAVAVATSLGLWLLGVPLALTLGLLAGLFNFVPFIGPIVTAIPAVLMAFTISPNIALYTALLYFVVQQLEGNVMQPLIQKWAVSLPPALTLISVVIFGLLFGIIGVIFATPMMVVLMVMVRKIYVQGALGRR